MPDRPSESRDGSSGDTDAPEQLFEIQAWSSLDESSAAVISSSRLDLACILEIDGALPPVMFENRDSLTKWATERGLRCDAIPHVRESSALRVIGDYRTQNQSTTFQYDQVWACATYSRYATALRTAALNGYKIDRAAFNGIHADHVINRARLRFYPHAWVMIVPVRHTANRPFGLIERELAPLPLGASLIELPPLVALKLFCGHLPKTRAELAQAMKDIRGNFLQDMVACEAFCNQIEAEAAPYLP